MEGNRPEESGGYRGRGVAAPRLEQCRSGATPQSRPAEAGHCQTPASRDDRYVQMDCGPPAHGRSRLFIELPENHEAMKICKYVQLTPFGAQTRRAARRTRRSRGAGRAHGSESTTSKYYAKLQEFGYRYLLICFML